MMTWVLKIDNRWFELLLPAVTAVKLVYSVNGLVQKITD
jgi:hypothetical protein